MKNIDLATDRGVHTLLRPAVWLMERLNYRQKFLLLGLVFVCASGVLLSALHAQFASAKTRLDGEYEGKMSTDSDQGLPLTYTGVPPGGWFGEGTVIKRETYRYNTRALRKSRVAGLPVDTFHWLLGNSIGFNRFVLTQLNERLGQFIGGREIERMNNADIRVARSLAAFLNPVLYPGFSSVLNITQQELVKRPGFHGGPLG